MVHDPHPVALPGLGGQHRPVYQADQLRAGRLLREAIQIHRGGEREAHRGQLGHMRGAAGGARVLQDAAILPDKHNARPRLG